MPKPDWNSVQDPEERSPEHGKRDNVHGPGEHGLGAVRDEAHEHGPKQAPDDTSIIEPDDEEAPA